MKLFHRLKSSMSTAVAAVVFSVIVLGARTASATPYASSISYSGGIVTFHLNEGGGSVAVTYEDNSVNPNFNGQTTGTNLPAGAYSFSLAGHTTYSIAVTKYGSGAIHYVDNSTINGVANPLGTTNSFFIAGNMRGLDVNKRVASPYFGRIYIDRSSPAQIFNFDSDGTFVFSNTAGVAWVSGNASSPYRMAIAADDYLSVGDASSAGAAIWRISPDLTANQLLLGPVGDASGVNAGVHGEIYSKPLLTGSLAAGNATLFEVDNDYPATAAQVNSDLIYSNLSLASLPCEKAPYVGPQIGLGIVNLANVYPGLSQGPNGYIYASEQRANCAIPNMYVFDSTGTTQLWSSIIKTNVSDYFVTSSGNGVAGLVDCAVSPDGKYLVGLAVDNHLTICSLTNGIPDVSTLFTAAPSSYNANGRGVCWDAADNLYTITSGSPYTAQQWTLGQSTLAVTTGNAAGTTAFGVTLLIPTVSVAATNAPVISQANSYGNPTTGAFTIVRTGGNLALPLTVNFTYGGTATNGTYTAGSTGSVVLAAGQTTTNISITAVTDGIARLTTAVTITLVPNPTAYSVVGAGTTSISILNTAPDKLVASVKAPSMYNAFSNDYAAVTLTRLGDTNASTYTVNNFTVAGTAVEGTDYTPPTPVTFSPGMLAAVSYIYPLINGQPPVHNPNLPYTGNKTVIVGVGSGSGYTTATNTATLTIIDSATPPATVLFSDPLTDANDATNWIITAADGDMPTIDPDVDVEFGSVLATEPYYAIPAPPNGASTALRITVNKNSGTGGITPMTAVNAYLANHQFSGNYAVRFNMNIIQSGFFGDTVSEDMEEGPLMGIDESGMETNWWAGSTLNAAATVTSWPADGIFYWLSNGGGEYFDTVQYEEFTGNNGALPNTGWEILGTQPASTFASEFKTNVFTSYASINFPDSPDSGWAMGGPGVVANGPGNYGYSDQSWSDVEIKQYNGVVTLSIDKTPIFVYTNVTTFTSGLMMLGYEDPINGGGDYDASAYFSNLRVVLIGPPSITEIATDKVHGTVVLNFMTEDALGAESFQVQSATSVTGPYTTIPATVTSLGGGAFQAVVPQGGAMEFYRVVQLSQ